MGHCYKHVIESIESVRKLVGGSSDISFQLNEGQCQILAEELVETSAFLANRGVCSKFGEGVGCISLLHLCSTIKRAELLVKKCCCQDLESWLVAAMMLVEIQEDFVAIILDIRLWRMLLDFAISSARGLSREMKAEEIKVMDEGYHELLKELRRESHALQQAAVEDKRTIISRITGIAEIHGSTTEVDYLRAIYMKSWLIGNVAHTNMNLNKFELPQTMGTGGCGTVFKVKWLGTDCALKVLNVQDEREATALKGLFHPNIIRLFYYWEDPPDNPKSHLLMELMPKDLGVHMKDLLNSMPSTSRLEMGKDIMPFSLPVAIDIMQQIAQAMRYMHDKHLTHRDLKPSNILVKERANVGVKCIDGEGYLDIKLADFGLVKSYENTSTNQEHTVNTGTPKYLAPEIFGKDLVEKRNYLPMADVWSFGITCAEILSGKKPYAEYANESRLAIQKRISKEGLRPALPKHCPDYVAFCISSCWELLPKRRPNFASICELLRHAKLLSLGVTNLDDSKLFFAYTTQSGHVKNLKLSPSSSSEWFSTFLQSSLKFMTFGVRPNPKIAKDLPSAVILHEERFIPASMMNEESPQVNEDISERLATPDYPAQLVEPLLDIQELAQQPRASGNAISPPAASAASASNSPAPLPYRSSGPSFTFPNLFPPSNWEGLRSSSASSSSHGDRHNGSREADGYQIRAPPPGSYQNDDTKPSWNNLLMAVEGVKNAANHFGEVLITDMNKHPFRIPLSNSRCRKQ